MKFHKSKVKFTSDQVTSETFSTEKFLINYNYVGFFFTVSAKFPNELFSRIILAFYLISFMKCHSHES